MARFYLTQENAERGRANTSVTHRQGTRFVQMCVCLCEREREREREIGYPRSEDKLIY